MEAVVEAGPVVAVVFIFRGVETFPVEVLNAADVLFPASVVSAVVLDFVLVPAEVLDPAVVTEALLAVSAHELLDWDSLVVSAKLISSRKPV